VETADALVLGGGPAGLAAALALSRAGASVALVERDGMGGGGRSEDAFTLDRRGIAHYHSPHAFLPRGAKVLRERAPDVYDALLELGALELGIARDQPDSRPEDAELVLLCVRRPLIEWALREAVLREPGVRIVSERVEGIRLSNGAVAGVASSNGSLRAPLVVDAMGRTSRMRRWLAEAGVDVAEESHEVGLVYYSRYYQLQPGVEFPPGNYPIGPRLDLGYLLCAAFLGDNRTFAFALMVPAADDELKTLRDPERHHACLAALPGLQDWVDPAVSRPTTGVASMGALRTTWRSYERTAPDGLVAVADAFCHTDPSFALGLSLGLVHGFALADAYGRDDLASFWSETVPELRERFELARDVSLHRLGRLRGQDETPSAAAATFLALGAAARTDPDLFRVAFRRIGFLDRLGPTEQQLPSPPPAPPPPLSRDELLAAIAAA
jgi:2-polyprenyl-6-methoxyphenol hydroxylase-like FAD-dependent oxidoreductase